MIKKIEDFIICFAVAWLFVSSICLAVTYTMGWKRGFEQCSQSWTENVDRIIYHKEQP